MDFFSEFNNLQKQIFKNVFSNTSSQSSSMQNKFSIQEQFVKPAKTRQNLKTSKKQKVEQNFVKLDENFSKQPTLIINPNFFAVKRENISQNGEQSDKALNLVPVNVNLNQNLSILNFKVAEVEKIAKNSKVTKNSLNSATKPEKSQPKKKTPKTKKTSPLSSNFLTPETSSDASNYAIKENSQLSKSNLKSSQKSKNFSGSERKLMKNVYDTPRTSYSLPLDSNEKNLRRGRSKFNKNFALAPETPQKALDEISQNEFMDYFGMIKSC